MALTADLGTERLTYRRLRVLVERLPRESGLVQARDVRATWSVTDYMLASLLDAVGALHYSYVSVHSPKGKRPAEPERLLRPGEKPRVAPGSRRIGAGAVTIEEWEAIKRRAAERGATLKARSAEIG